MAALATNVTSFHKDIRSESRGYKRDKQHSIKWNFGTRPRAGVHNSVNWEPQDSQPEQNGKVRPQKKGSDVGHASWKTNANISSKADSAKWHPHGLQGRVARKQDALGEISSSPPSLSKSMMDLLPSSGQHNARSPSVDSGITYSFDAVSGPRKVVGLDSLVDKAEKEFAARETDKMVKTEYEVLDGSGESIMIPKRGKKGSPKQKAVVLEADDEDDWERI